MIVGFDRLSASSVSILGSGATPVWLSPTEELFDSDPQSTSRLALSNLITDGPPVLAYDETVQAQIRVDSLLAGRYRLIGLLGFSYNGPHRLIVQLEMRRAVDLTYDYTPAGLSISHQPMGLPNERGRASVWWLLPEDIDLVAGFQIRIYGRRFNGTLQPDPTDYPSASLNSNTTFDIGEIVALRALDLPIQEGFEQQFIDPTITRRTIGSRISRVARIPYRQLSGNLPANTTAVQRNEGLPDDMDWVQLEQFLLQSRDCAVAFQDKRNLVFNQDELNKNCFLSVCAPGPTRHVQGQYYSKSLRFEELPT